MCDLVFIVFDSANLSLAFDTLFDVRWSCRSSDSSAEFQFNSSVSTQSPQISQKVLTTTNQAANTIEPICSRQEALAAFLFLALCAWVSTFMVSVFRYVLWIARELSAVANHAQGR